MTASPTIETLEEAWRASTDEVDDGVFFAAWLARVTSGLAGAQEAVLVLGEVPNAGPFRPVAFWPRPQTCSADLAAVCERALDLRKPLTSRTGARIMHAQPVSRGGELYGIVAVACAGATPSPRLQEELAWGCGWLLSRLAERHGDAGGELREGMMLSLDLIVGALEEETEDAACQAVATEAATRLGCDRVSIGFTRRKLVRLAALSQSASVQSRLDLTRAVEAAMNETLEQGVPIRIGVEVEAGAGAPPMLATGDHARLSRDFGADTILSVPFAFERQTGVFVFEWAGRSVPPRLQAQAEALALLLGRVLIEKRKASRGVLRRLVDGGGEQLRRLLGPLHTGRKLAVLCVLTVGLFFALATGTYKVSADAAVEGAVRRVVVAPFDGFIAASSLRAGEQVRQGDRLAALDDRDLRLEVQRWSSQRVQYQRQAQAAQAQADLAQLQIALAQVQQAEAQLALAEAALERSVIRAPFDGLIVAGDLSQHMGAAVRKGQVLFELAPLDGWRLVLKVDERDIARVEEGQTGELVVAALTGETIPFTVTMVTPVASAKDGRNTFRVEAQIDRAPDRLRPGMEGVGKVVIGERRLIWIWTHRLTTWARLQLWSWFGI